MLYFNKTIDLIDFLKVAFEQSALFTSVTLTGSACYKEEITLIDDIDLVFISKKEDLEKATAFLSTLKSIFGFHIDYDLAERPEDFSKFHLLWTSQYLKKDIIGKLDYQVSDLNLFRVHQKTKTKDKTHFPEFKLNLVFPKIDNYYSLKEMRNFIAEYTYIQNSKAYKFYDKEKLIQDLSVDKGLLALKDLFLNIYRGQNLIEATEKNSHHLYKIFLLAQDLMDQYKKDKHDFCL